MHFGHLTILSPLVKPIDEILTKDRIKALLIVSLLQLKHFRKHYTKQVD